MQSAAACTSWQDVVISLGIIVTGPVTLLVGVWLVLRWTR